MRKTNFIDILRVIVVFILVLPLFLAWIPMECYSHLLAENLVKGNFFRTLVLTFDYFGFNCNLCNDPFCFAWIP